MRKVILVLLCALAAAAQAQPFPNHPVKIVVGISPGSFTDIAARALAADLGEQFGQQFVVENKPGAGGTLGADLVAKSAPDGHTLLMTENSFTMAAALYPKLPFDSIRDFAPVAIVAEAPYILWSRLELPVKDIRELVELAKRSPGTLTFGSGGQGSSSHLSAELFFDKAGISVVHVPFKGVAPAIAEVVAGRVDFGGSSLASPISQIRAGKLRPLALTGRERSPMLPDVPTFGESGFAGYDASIWFGVIAPAGTPATVLARLQDAFGKAVAKPAVRELFQKQGAAVLNVPGAEFAKRIAAEIQASKALVAKRGIKVD